MREHPTAPNDQVVGLHDRPRNRRSDPHGAPSACLDWASVRAGARPGWVADAGEANVPSRALLPGRTRNDLGPRDMPDCALVGVSPRRDAVTGGKRELDALIEEITVDCYNEDEELSGFLTYLDDALEQPVEATVVARLLAADRHWAGQDPRPKATP